MKENVDEIKIHVFGIPMFANEYKIFSLINSISGGPYHCMDSKWKKVHDSSSEYFEFYMSYGKVKNKLKKG